MAADEIKVEITDAINRIRTLARERSITDTRMSGVWILVIILAPLLMFIAALIAFMMSTSVGQNPLRIFTARRPLAFISGVSVNFNSSSIGVAGFELIIILVTLVSGTLIAVLYYKLISRMNMHFKRSSMLREALIDLVTTLSKLRGATSRELSFIKTLHSELRYREGPKPAGLHAVLSVIIPFYWLYVAYFLTNDWQEHELREREFFKSAVSELRSLGINVPTIYWEEMPRRSAGLYLVLTIALGGLFAIYWLWTLIKDPDRHFISHVRLEDALVESLETFSRTLSS